MNDKVNMELIELARKEVELTRALLRAWQIYQLLNSKGELNTIFTKNSLNETLDSVLALMKLSLLDKEIIQRENKGLKAKISVLYDSSRENRNLKAEIAVLNRDLRRMRKRFR